MMPAPAWPELRIRTETIHDLLRHGDLRRLRRTLTRLDEVQIASQLDNLDLDDLQRVMQLLPGDRRPLVVANMRYEAVGGLLGRLAPEQAAELVDELNVDDAVDILGRIDEARLEEILARLDKDDAEELEELLAYEDDSAGGIMSTQLRRGRPGCDHGARRSPRCTSRRISPSTSFYVFVVEPSGKLVGTCELRMLVISKPNERVRDIMQTEVVAVRVDTDQEQVADVVSRYDLVTVPVVDGRGVLLGVIEVDDVVDVIREEATEDILKMAGAGEELAEARAFWPSLRVRWRWLMAAAVGGSVAAMSLSRFDTALADVPALAFFMPVVAGMGGNVGIQSSTIVVRGLAVGFLEAERLRAVVTREVGLGALAGAHLRRAHRPGRGVGRRVADRAVAAGGRGRIGLCGLDDRRGCGRHLHAARARSPRRRPGDRDRPLRHDRGRRHGPAVLLLARLDPARGRRVSTASRCDAIVLATRPLGEADVLAVLFTAMHGKVRCRRALGPAQPSSLRRRARWRCGRHRRAARVAHGTVAARRVHAATGPRRARPRSRPLRVRRVPVRAHRRAHRGDPRRARAVHDPATRRSPTRSRPRPNRWCCAATSSRSCNTSDTCRRSTRCCVCGSAICRWRGAVRRRARGRAVPDRTAAADARCPPTCSMRPPAWRPASSVTALSAAARRRLRDLTAGQLRGHLRQPLRSVAFFAQIAAAGEAPFGENPSGVGGR